MLRHPKSEIGLAVLLAVLAGYVDALGFISLGGFFVSFMSGNSTRLGIGIADGVPAFVATAGGLIALFVAGVVLGTLAAAGRGRRREIALGIATLLLLSAAALETGGRSGLSIAAMALAMGVMNTVFERNGEVSIGVTYMTGTLVKMGQRIAGALLGGSRTAFLPYGLLWLGLVAGAIIGAMAHGRFGLSAVWGAWSYAAVLFAVAALMRPPAGRAGR
jgi:uncharacterized membrane protein YoaK (UPF0700 family)